MRLIDGDKLLEVIAEQERWNVPDFVYESIKNAPTIDAEPVRHGHWNIIKGMPTQCSSCGYYVKQKTYKYCPYCGAKMEGVEE